MAESCINGSQAPREVASSKAAVSVDGGDNCESDGWRKDELLVSAEEVERLLKFLKKEAEASTRDFKQVVDEEMAKVKDQTGTGIQEAINLAFVNFALSLTEKVQLASDAIPRKPARRPRAGTATYHNTTTEPTPKTGTAMTATPSKPAEKNKSARKRKSEEETKPDDHAAGRDEEVIACTDVLDGYEDTEPLDLGIPLKKRMKLQRTAATIPDLAKAPLEHKKALDSLTQTPKRKWKKDLDDAALKTQDARLKTEFKQMYPDFPGWQEVWTAFNQGTVDFDLDNKAVAWCIALGWLATWAHVATDSPEPAALKRFQKARLEGGPGCTVENTGEYLLWLSPLHGPDEQGVDVAIISESYIDMMKKGTTETKFLDWTLRHPDEINDDHLDRFAAIVAKYIMSPLHQGEDNTAEPAAPAEPVASAGPVKPATESLYDGDSVFDENAGEQ